MSCDQDALLAAAAFLVIANKKINKKAKPRRFWVRPSLQSREIYTTSHLLTDLISDDTDILNLEYRCNGGFRNFFRMSPSQFNELLNMVIPSITKNDTNFRKAIPAQDRLAITLRFLATGDFYYSLSYLFKISKQTISKTVPEVCKAIVDVLKEYLCKDAEK
ncbi:uncharacterized protein LOC132953338 [Metopolophium dirhodum]|uniref:uncharacterized protein LOC132953338 n=1 Tax=Metopolophium dirhodum TaxID=44670 RepID=UPI00298FEB8A|nr:uncharacterized protein LOC132953338 [Metopolophium dirhodum]